MAFKDNYDSGETELKSTASQDSPIHCSVDENHPYGDGLPPVDGGRHAWLFLLASAMLEALVWGYAFSFGIFQKYYSTHEPFQGSNNIAAIGTCAMGIAYLIAPLPIIGMILLPQIARWVSTIGVILMCFSLALSSFSTSVTHLILSQGIGFGVGGSLAYTPSILFMPEWFVKRKGLAFGVVWSGSGLSGVLFPLAIEWLLNRYGVPTTLRISSVGLFLLSIPFLYFHRPRIPVSHSVVQRRINFRFLYSKVFLIYQIGNTVQALGFFLPTIYLPTYASQMVFGSIIIGFLSDRYHVTTCLLITTAGSVISVFFIWGFSSSLWSLYVFCIVYGLLAGGYSSTWSSIAHEIQHANPATDVSVIFPFMETGRGIGNVASGPLSEALLKVDGWQSHAWGTYGSRYGTIVLWTGITALIGGLAVMARYLKCV
ncbi:hypothetical protein N7509_001481 [Penicillium cosmopolitanum]|uniref:Major facilitator superfamily (MFS) profile domain-containing protein n=1 Tax=Penicillium cosmopolitanum TaxID=1131564 RepID=A0A9W9W782_9EURO|nr:uncharacterized protein N7509_001481 [Penicillium cosmopolitanum]KAJ5407598.1 hypothetical protein N7509_001481 [Penicillium cosmopolitanum]